MTDTPRNEGPEERREADRRNGDQVLAETVNDLVEEMRNIRDGTFEVPGTGRTAIEIAGEHDTLFANQASMNHQLGKVVDYIEGVDIISPLNGNVIGHEPGNREVTAEINSKLGTLIEGTNGGTGREWTPAQRWTIGIALTVFAGLLFVLIPIAIEIASTPGLP